MGQQLGRCIVHLPPASSRVALEILHRLSPTALAACSVQLSTLVTSPVPASACLSVTIFALLFILMSLFVKYNGQTKRYIVKTIQINKLL